MGDIVDPRHEAYVEHIFIRICGILDMRGFELKALRRRKRGTGAFRSITYGYTYLTEKKITVDLYTPKTMKPRKMDAIIRVICHELAHHQEPPRACWWKGRRVTVVHHPRFWKQYKKNVLLMTKDDLLGEHFPLSK